MDLSIYYNDLKKLESMYRKTKSIKQKYLIYADYKVINKLLLDNFTHNISDNIELSESILLECEKYNFINEKKSFLDEIEFFTSLSKYNGRYLKLYKNNDYYPYYIKYPPKINKEKYEKLSIDFIKTLNNEFKKTFNVLNDNGRIIEMNENPLSIDAAGFCYPNLVSEKTYIGLIENQTPLFYTALIHELGHAWSFNYLKNYSKINYDNKLIELPSTLLEIMFIKYLENNNIKESEYLMYNKLLDFLYSNYQGYIMYQNYKQNNKTILYDDNNYDLFIPINTMENNKYFNYLDQRFFSKDNNYYIFDLTYMPYYVGTILSLEILDKYDFKTSLELVKELMIKSLTIDPLKLIEDTKILNNCEGFEKVLIKNKKYNRL